VKHSQRIRAIHSVSTEAYGASVDLFEEGAMNNVNDAETDPFVEIELDIELDNNDESDHSDDEFDSESDSGLGGMDSNAIETEYNDFLEIE
ncbi:Uncharacterized protein APZ42_004239, partial [Daphnia magna]